MGVTLIFIINKHCYIIAIVVIGIKNIYIMFVQAMVRQVRCSFSGCGIAGWKKDHTDLEERFFVRFPINEER